MPVSEELIAELESEYSFLGITAPPEARGWSELELREFFDSDGVQTPSAPTAAPPPDPPGPSPPTAAPAPGESMDAAATAHQRPGGLPIDVGKKVVFVGLKTETCLNNTVGEVSVVDSAMALTRRCR